jgi:hypothetical protein
MGIAARPDPSARIFFYFNELNLVASMVAALPGLRLALAPIPGFARPG